ncbi:uncharacterized protein LOC119832422 [Zerene cesonia]|uniref:uncharacterized protein LOC119832422 n=1 Tax=Zerene cesonia TaxID=33412 RepID=UPI0018E54E95|nr:uncharacterized protein LOC119832422 [Zerene cesonia]
MLLFFLLAATATAELPQTCIKPVYCNSKLLHHVQMQRIFPDSKTFVDLRLVNDENSTLTAFQNLLDETNNNPNKKQVQEFVEKYFDKTSELESWTPPDFNKNPPILPAIRDEDLRQYAKDINDIWPVLGRKVKQAVFENPDQYSLIPVTHGFIIPGGRFTELYYWDTYWIIEGLLVSGMEQTVKGIIGNLIELLNKLGHIPNGSRWYYQERSQPPLLSAMMSLYIRATNDIEFLKENVDALEAELEYWLDTQIYTFDIGDRAYTLLRYYAPSEGPRPESYYEDFSSAQIFDTKERQTQYYIDLKSAAESGWDFSTRWFINDDGTNKGNLTMLHATEIIPVDLNSIFANALQNMAYFQGLLKNGRKGAHWAYLAKQWRNNIKEVLWDDEDGVWYDWDLANKQFRKYFYPSNVAPLWMGAVEKSFVKTNAHRIFNYLQQSHGLDYPGGVPTSLIRSGEQWDFPNAWPPLVSLMVNALEALEIPPAKELAFDVAQAWVRACHKGFSSTKQMFEKYDVEVPGRIGGGGEYTVQTGFGWSNGVVMEFLAKYGRRLTLHDVEISGQNEAVVSRVESDGENSLSVVAAGPDPQLTSSSSGSSSSESKESDEKKEYTMLIQNLRRYAPLYPVLGILGACAQAFTVVPACNSSIYCTGELLHRVQLARIFEDSKTFVDLKLVRSENETLADFSKLMQKTRQNPSREQIASFVDEHFTEGNELEDWRPPDFDPDPPILKGISDLKLREFAKNVIGLWDKLGRKVNPDVDKQSNQYSFLYVPNGFIVPGGRFKELYYWDSFWIVRGLLLCNMTETARGMIENLLYLVEKLGYIPNGSRIYYLGRSQPPMLAAMMASYFAATGDLAWLEKHLPTVEKELQYWLDKKKVTVEVNGKNYVLLRYIADRKGKGPRPESYYEDYTNARDLPNDTMREDFYAEMKSAAESGWDFSTRWFVTAENDVVGKLTDVHASRIVPVDLNAIFAGALDLVGDFRNRLKDRREAQKWWSLAKYWRNAIENVLWDNSDGVWYDYDAQARAPRRHFYPSCATPLWAGAIEDYDAPKYASRLIRYLLSSGALDFPGGVPSSVLLSGEQWDYPNAWPPSQSILIGGLEASGNEEAQKLALEQASIWIRSNYIGYSTWQKMFEKYSAVQPGHQGGGGEYGVQDGFGWTNGVVLELLQRYGKEMTLHDKRGVSLPYVRQVL